ncbi:MAG: CoA-binding protein [Saprospiraceae bacterium]|nr:CoA-binding protein [Saprospiraceae bacterium]
MKKTLVLGASTNPTRASHQAVHRLLNNGHEPVLVGIKEGDVAGIDIQHGQPELADIDTVTLYMNPKRQVDQYEYILGLEPKRIIFNPGTENPTLMRLAREKGIEVEIACTLVMLATDQY